MNELETMTFIYSAGTSKQQGKSFIKKPEDGVGKDIIFLNRRDT